VVKYLLDTDTLVEFFRDRGNVAARLAAHPLDELAVSSVSLAELYYGASKAQRPGRLAQVEMLVALLRRLDFDAAAARLFGPLRGSLEQSGQRLDDMDLMIASIALAHGLILVTHNAKHFGRVPGLVSEDWTI
jgi:tRNA(fMet)-specific endonuclease VapC